MTRSGLLYDTPISLQSASCCDDQCFPLYLRDAESKTTLVVLHKVTERTVIIQLANDNRELIVGANGRCFFESSALGIGEEFKVECAVNGSLVFVSCRTGNVLESDGEGLPRCMDTIRRGWMVVQLLASDKVDDEKAAVEAPLTMASLCDDCRALEAKERRDYIMKLITLGKSLDEIDAILLRMYA